MVKRKKATKVSLKTCVGYLKRGFKTSAKSAPLRSKKAPLRAGRKLKAKVKGKNCAVRIKYDKYGYQKKITNPCGKKPSVYIFQGARPGFTAAYDSKPYKRLPGSKKNAEKYAAGLIAKGHKKVTFRD